MKKTLLRTIALLIMMILCTSPVFALTINTGDTENFGSDSSSGNDVPSSNSVVSGVTTMEVVEKNICEIDLKDPATNDVVGNFTKELSDFDASKKAVTLTLTLNNIMEEEEITKPVEVYLVLDNSNSMDLEYQGKAKKEYVATTAKLFTDSLFEYFENVKVGIVAFSSVDTVADPSATLGTTSDAKLLLSLSDSKETIENTLDDTYFETNGPCTNIEAGLDLAQKNFTTSTDSNKYVILISDGIPNLSLDTENSLQYSGVNATRTKAKLQSMQEAGYNIFSVLMGLNEADTEKSYAPMIADGSRHMTYRELAEEIFGTTSNPTAGNFYYIDYNSLDTTVNTDIYGNITEIKDNSLKKIVIKDYFPQEIIDNFNFEYVKSPNIGEVSEEVDTTDNSITWKIELLNAGEVATLSYKLTLKDDYNKEIVDKILPTNSKVDIDYNYNNVDGNADSTVSPTVRVKEITTNIEIEPTEPTEDLTVKPSEDDTIAKTPIPQTGVYTTILFAIAIAGIIVFAIIKVNQIKKLK